MPKTLFQLKIFLSSLVRWERVYSQTRSGSTLTSPKEGSEKGQKARQCLVLEPWQDLGKELCSIRFTSVHH
jgi:hypothetical protein